MLGGGLQFQMMVLMFALWRGVMTLLFKIVHRNTSQMMELDSYSFTSPEKMHFPFQQPDSSMGIGVLPKDILKYN